MARRAAFVTGASQGIGAAIALALARDGFDVAVSSTQPAKLGAVRKRIEEAGARAVPVELDVRSQAGVEHAMDAAAAALGPIEVLVNNAGIPLKKSAADTTPAEWNEVIATNLTGTFFMSQQMGRHLVRGGRPGCIISIASTHGLLGVPQRLAYGVAKAGILHMTKMLAVEWAAHGIRVNAIAPGRIETAARSGSYGDPRYIQWALDRVPLHRFGTAEEVAAAACYLASPAASYVTGQTLVLDGGLTAQ